MPLTLRPFAVSDSTPARALADIVLGDAPFAEPLLAALEKAIEQRSDEYQMVVAQDRNALVGLVVFGEIAGTLHTGRVHFIAVDASARRRGIALELLNAACDRLRDRGGRLVMMEVPTDARLASIHRLAGRAGFHEEGRMDDYVRDGVALVLLCRDMGRSPSVRESTPASV